MLQEADLKKIRARMEFLQMEWPMRVDEKLIRYYALKEQRALTHMLAPAGPLALSVSDSRELDIEIDGDHEDEDPQEEPEEFEFDIADWIKKDHYFHYTAMDKVYIEAFEKWFANEDYLDRGVEETQESTSTEVITIPDEESLQEEHERAVDDWEERMVRAREWQTAQENFFLGCAYDPMLEEPGFRLMEMDPEKELEMEMQETGWTTEEEPDCEMEEDWYRQRKMPIDSPRGIPIDLRYAILF